MKKEERTQRILAEATAQLARDRAPATGIGLFLVPHTEFEVLLRRRLEKESLYGQDLSGKWELIGGGVEIPHLTNPFVPSSITEGLSKYQQAIFSCLGQELMEEAGLELLRLSQPLNMVPAWLYRDYVYKDKVTEVMEDRTGIDLAFSALIPFDEDYLGKTQEFQNKMLRGELMLVPVDRLAEIEMVSPRMRYLTEEPLKLLGMI